MGVRGLCNGLGPAAFGLMWHFFGINIIRTEDSLQGGQANLTEIYLGGNFSHVNTLSQPTENFNVTEIYQIPGESEALLNMPGLPFLISSFSVILSLILSVLWAMGSRLVSHDTVREYFAVKINSRQSKQNCVSDQTS